MIITVPHAYCPPYTRYHLCDHAAKRIALSISYKLKNLNVDHHLFISNIYRYDCDLNRIQCRGLGFRPKLTRLLGSNSINLLFDIHSFPGNDNNDDFYILIDESNININNKIDNMISNLHDAVPPDINYNIYRGVNNDIIDEALSYNIPALLIEFSEIISKEKLDKIIDIIISWIRKL